MSIAAVNVIHYNTDFCIISNNIEVYEEPMPRTKKIPHCVVKFEAGEANRIVQENVYCLYTF